MLTHSRVPVCLSLTAFDLPLWSVLETDATIYQREGDRFHVLLTEPLIQEFVPSDEPSDPPAPYPPTLIATPTTPRLLWFEISPYRVIMTMQGNGALSYRHFWEQGVYGLSRFWLQDQTSAISEQLKLRNFTRNLKLMGQPVPHHLRIEYELWSNQLQLGRYVLNLEIKHPDIA